MRLERSAAHLIRSTAPRYASLFSKYTACVLPNTGAVKYKNGPDSMPEVNSAPWACHDCISPTLDAAGVEIIQENETRAGNLNIWNACQIFQTSPHNFRWRANPVSRRCKHYDDYERKDIHDSDRKNFNSYSLIASRHNRKDEDHKQNE